LSPVVCKLDVCIVVIATMSQHRR